MSVTLDQVMNREALDNASEALSGSSSIPTVIARGDVNAARLIGVDDAAVAEFVAARDNPGTKTANSTDHSNFDETVNERVASTALYTSMAAAIDAATPDS